MSKDADPVHLNNHHRATLAKIFQHPVSHNLDWKEVLSLLRAFALVEERHDGKFSVTLGETTTTLEAPKHKSVDAQDVLDLRHLFEGAGFGPKPH
jgi:hypothetical protein